MAAKIFGYKITDPTKITQKLMKLQTNIMSVQIDAVRDATLLVHATAVESLQENNDGTPTLRYQPKRVVNVSAPGSPPNTDTGRAVQSIKFDFKDQGMVGRVGTNLKYLAGLEFGTKFVEARPWLSTALTSTQSEIKKIFQAAFKKSTGGVK